MDKNQILCMISGTSRAIISAERVALNFLQTLSAVATKTRYLVDKIAHTNASTIKGKLGYFCMADLIAQPIDPAAIM
jgi:nicotinate-nucleotide pyrophosphorylase